MWLLFQQEPELMFVSLKDPPGDWVSSVYVVHLSNSFVFLTMGKKLRIKIWRSPEVSRDKGPVKSMSKSVPSSKNNNAKQK